MMDDWEQARPSATSRPTAVAGLAMLLVVGGAVLLLRGGGLDEGGLGSDRLTIEPGAAPGDPASPEDGAFDPEADGTAPAPTDPDPGDGSDQPEGGADLGTWEALSPAPIAPRLNHVAIWTGERVLVWGGFDTEFLGGPDEDGATGGERLVGLADGALYDPVTDSWQRIPPAPIDTEHMGFIGGVWTGEEFIALSDPRPAAFAPETGEWRLLSAPPEANWRWQSAAWTDSGVIVLGSATPAGRARERVAAAYDPATDQWESLPSPPILDARTAGLDGRMVVYGPWSGGPGTVNAITAYDPRTGEWTEPDPIPVEGRLANALRGITADPARGRVVLLGARDVGDWSPFLASWQPPPGEGWRALPGAPPGSTGVRELTALRQGTIAWLPGAPAGLMLGQEGWEQFSAAPLGGRVRSSAVWTGDELIVWGGRSATGNHDDGARWRRADGDADDEAPDLTRGEWPLALLPR